MPWRLFGAKPVSEPMLTRFIDIYVTLGGDELIYLTSTMCLFQMHKPDFMLSVDYINHDIFPGTLIRHAF